MTPTTELSRAFRALADALIHLADKRAALERHAQNYDFAHEDEELGAAVAADLAACRCVLWAYRDVLATARDHGHALVATCGAAELVEHCRAERRFVTRLGSKQLRELLWYRELAEAHRPPPLTPVDMVSCLVAIAGLEPLDKGTP